VSRSGPEAAVAEDAFGVTALHTSRQCQSRRLGGGKDEIVAAERVGARRFNLSPEAL
jgi:hypothetical protein